MANIDTGGGEVKRGKPKKINLRVDFTPMVDMNMLLLTFFMFCTSLSKPQTMDIVLPTKDNQELTDEDKTKIKDSKAITLLLGEDNKVYYYFGKPNYEDYTSLKETNYTPEGLRAVLLERNAVAVNRMTDLKRKRKNKEVSDEEFKRQSSEIKNDPDNQIVVIKPTDSSTYKNLVDALDEMQICSIGKYALVDVQEGDLFLLENYKGKGTLSAEIASGQRK